MCSWKRWSKSLAIRGMPIEREMTYHYITIRRAKTKNSETSNTGEHLGNCHPCIVVGIENNTAIL